MISHQFPTRGLIAFGVLIGTIAVTVGAGYYLTQNSQAQIEVKNVQYLDPPTIGKVSEISVTVTNKGATPIEPKFKITHSSHQTRTYWDIVGGPESLKEGENATYRIRAPHHQAAIPYHSSATLAINDNATQEQVVYGPFSPTHPPNHPRPAFNPQFKYWKLVGNEKQVPFRWSHQDHANSEANTDIHRKDGSGAVTLTVSNDTRAGGGGPWTMSSIVQSVSVPQKITLTAQTSKPTKSPTKYPNRASGLEFAEGNHRIWVVMANVSSRKIVTRQSGNLDYVIVYLPTEPNQKATSSVDVNDIYARQGWTYPKPEPITLGGVNYQQRRSTVRGFVSLYPSANTSSASVTLYQVKTEYHANSKNT